MGRPKLSPEEALKRKRESIRRSKNKPEALQRRRELDRKRIAVKRLKAKSRNTSYDNSESKKRFMQKSRADPVKYAREIALKRERRKRKREERISNPKRVRLDSEPVPSTSGISSESVPSTSGLSTTVKKKRFRSSEKLWDKAQTTFFRNISDGPIHRCVCCDRLWFKKSISTLSKTKLRNKPIPEQVIECIFPNDMDEGQFCATCKSSILMKKVPPLAVCNGFKYPNQPECLANLNDLEERLVSLRIPFMQIKERSFDRQYGIKGTVVNVPITWNETVCKLPKNINDTATVWVKLKKRLRFRSDYMYRNINPNRVFDAATYLMQTPLYRANAVPLDMEWLEKFKNESFDPGNNRTFEMSDSEEEDSENDDSSNENDEDFPNPEPVETVIQGDISAKMGIALAPGEDKVPISLVFDELAEELSYPKIYCGEVRQFPNKNPTYTQIIKSELRRYDRRGSTPQKILYSHQKLLHQKLLSCISVYLRQKAFDEASITAENLRNPDYVKSMQFKNLAYKFLKNIKNSPAHWSNERSRVCAQIRQFGFPSIFLTLSAAENRWFDLIKHLVFIRENRILSESEFETLSTTYRNDLISKDPVVCSLYFEHKMKETWKTFSCKEGPFQNFKINHFYQRTEFQQRGSPHFHVLLWLEGAPRYDGTNAQEVENFIDKLITCSGNTPFAKLQTHRHTFTCKKKSIKKDNDYCRFNIPFFPMDRTRIVLPLAVDDEQRNPEKFKMIREVLNEMEGNPLQSSTFQDFLRHLNMSFDEYLLAIRSGINRPTVCLKRNVDEILLNGYNSKILSLMQSNMDIQFVLDEYAVVAYLVDYINKPGRGLTKIMRECIKAVSEKRISLKECLKEVSNQFLNAVEISAQEAAWSILELPMSKMSEDTIFIQTFRPEERTRMIKSAEALKELEPCSRDVFDLNIIDYYKERPQILEQECLANFAAWYEIRKVGEANMKLRSSEKFVRLRTKPKVIQYRKYKQTQDENEYFREQIMLYTPWRDEKEDILSKNFNELYTANLELIKGMRKKFSACDDLELERELMMLEQSRTEEEINELELEESDLQDFESVLEYDEKEMGFGDISLDMQAATGKHYQMFQPTHKYTEEKYREKWRQCNQKQRDILLDIKNHLKSKPNEQLYMMIEGAAGTGKSFLIDILEQMLIRKFEKPDQDPTQPTVIKLAPTGMAASNIHGETLHHALGIGFSKDSHLGGSSIADYTAKFFNLEAVIIDEISMVGANMYDKMNNHLKLFKGNEKKFGGLHIFHFGDFKQLPPVKDTPIFKQKKGLNQLTENVWYSVQYYELTEIMRQKDDKAFAELLNRVGMSDVTDGDEEFLKTKQTTLERVPNAATLLYHSNKEVDLANKLRLNSIEGNIVECLAYDSVSGTAPRKTKRKALVTVRTLDRTKTANLQFNIKCKIGLKYMLLYNVDTADGLVNGAVGVLRHMEYCSVKGSEKQEVKRIWVEFNKKETGREKRRQALRYAIVNNINLDWTPIDRMKRVIYTKNNGSISVTRNQFPLVVAEAMTIHKSQGATFHEVAIGFKSGLQRPLQYVGLSRVTSANGLYILGEYNKPAPPREDDPIFIEMKRLKQSAIIPKFAFLHQHSDPNTLQIMYHNVQSLNAHYDDIAADPCMMNSDILLFAETWTVSRDKFELDGFNQYHLISGCTTRKASGVSVYIKNHLCSMIEEVKQFPNYEMGIHVMVVNFKTKIRIAVLYAKPTSSDDDIFDAIEESLDVNRADYKTVLAGDFNIDVSTPRGREFCDTMENDYFLKLRNNPCDSTTIFGTTIDSIFSSNIVRVCGVYESVFSNHLPLYVQIPWEKMTVRTPFPPIDDDPRLECGPDLYDWNTDIDWDKEDDFPM